MMPKRKASNTDEESLKRLAEKVPDLREARVEFETIVGDVLGSGEANRDSDGLADSNHSSHKRRKGR